MDPTEWLTLKTIPITILVAGLVTWAILLIINKTLISRNGRGSGWRLIKPYFAAQGLVVSVTAGLGFFQESGNQFEAVLYGAIAAFGFSIVSYGGLWLIMAAVRLVLPSRCPYCLSAMESTFAGLAGSNYRSTDRNCHYCD